MYGGYDQGAVLNYQSGGVYKQMLSLVNNNTCDFTDPNQA